MTVNADLNRINEMMCRVRAPLNLPAHYKCAGAVEILEKLGIPLYIDNLTLKNSHSIIYKIQEELLEYFDDNNDDIEAVYKDYEP